MANNSITIETTVRASIEKVWDAWTKPEHITQWAFASDDWEAPSATNDLRVGGMFATRMQAKDRSAGFDFGGTYTEVKEYERIAYTINGDNRKVETTFQVVPAGVKITQTFEMEHENSEEKQRAGWQSILESFRRYTESR